MSGLAIVTAVAAVVALGLAAATRARASRATDTTTLAALGFDARATTGRPLALRDGAVVVPLARAPLAYDVLARALGRGDLLAALYELDATAAADHLRLPLDPRPSLRAQRRRLTRALDLARALETLPLPEAMARWFLDGTGGPDLATALASVLAAYPDAPATLGACRVERDQPRDPKAAALARAHLAHRAPPLDAIAPPAYE